MPFSMQIVPAALALFTLFAAPLHAAAISVMPTRLEIPAGSTQTTMTIRAGRDEGVAVQIRVFAWAEGQPPTQISPTNAVAVSPPIAQIGRRQELTVRIVRTARSAVRGRECYRVLVDTLPTQAEGSGRIALRMRHSVPLCFNG
ncbi:molecular chaperone [Palleronia sp. LCG004]|uniref:fimbrial biogenesis chaperone n=1 Tax=Palleronia sp. LCG004 TaxID=3079304 RepID=UPI002943EF86|nr:fimbria/pilus periplasmic chaperone [Palleronia sp. LCG004]WOI58436.1 fimbria/pilus periplasmic chaperone [Palleronia sp. LCG004]